MMGIFVLNATLYNKISRLIKIWSKHNMMLLNTMKGHSRPINHVEVSSCNKYIASSSDDGTVRIWSLKTFE